jgi:hypothetical protein
MQTIRHKRLAKLVLKCATKGEAMIKAGYKPSYAKTGNILKMEGFKEANKPSLEKYQNELSAILYAMRLKNKHSEAYKVLVEAADKVQKQIQLLSGGATGNVGVIVKFDTAFEK